MTNSPQTLDETLSERLHEVATGAAATEGDLRVLVEQAQALARTLSAAIGASERKLAELASTPGAPLAEMASELQRIERLRWELDDLNADLDALERRARSLRGAWMRR